MPVESRPLPFPGGRPRVVVTRKLPEAVEARMRELFEVDLNLSDAPMSREALAAAVNRADVLVPALGDRIDAGLIGQAGPDLKLIANYGAGVDHIDVETARRRGIHVSNTPGVLTEDTADMTMALMLAVPRRLQEGAKIIEAEDEAGWKGWSPTFLNGRRITGKRLGILGMGRIGRAVARRARGFGMAVHYHNRKRVHESVENELEATYWESLDQMLARVDLVSVNCPHTPATYHLLSARRLQLSARRQQHSRVERRLLRTFPRPRCPSVAARLVRSVVRSERGGGADATAASPPETSCAAPSRPPPPAAGAIELEAAMEALESVAGAGARCPLAILLWNRFLAPAVRNICRSRWGDTYVATEESSGGGGSSRRRRRWRRRL